VRIFLSGNEDVARWHLPVAQSKVDEFVARTQKAGLAQNTYQFLFEETGTKVFAQYAFGKTSLQIYSPSIPMVEEESKDDVSGTTEPKIFWVHTTRGYFWVEVRYADGRPMVVLTPFEAVRGDEFVYPGFALNSPGMIAGNFDDTPETRYVLAQNGGVIGSELEVVGVIKSEAITDPMSRITVVTNEDVVHDFVLMKNDGGKIAEIRRIKITPDVIERFYSSIYMEFEGETALTPAQLYPNPCWIHRKCAGSYFSPNKTIGYHVDIGIDDYFLGNMSQITNGDFLDNTGGADESLFNHTKDLYRLAGLLNFPLETTETTASFVLVSPTMRFDDDPQSTKKCWGGYGVSQSSATCADYQQDFSAWYLAPRLVKVDVDFASGTKTFKDLSGTNGTGNETCLVKAWDESFSASFVFSRRSACTSTVYEDTETKEVGAPCVWSEECLEDCGVVYDPVGYTGECPKLWTAREHWSMFFREDIKNEIKIYFLFGENEPKPTDPGLMNGFFFLFDGLWHLDVGVHWSTTELIGNSCKICCLPVAGQEPGQNVEFYITGADPDWVIANGHEFVENLEVVRPLGYAESGGGLTFLTKVPEYLAAPSPPVVCVGGVRYKSQNIPGAMVMCQRKFMSRPCLCEENPFSWNPTSTFSLGATNLLAVIGGCPPYDWRGSGVTFVDGSNQVVPKNVLETMAAVYAITDPCVASVAVSDACAFSLEKEESVDVTTGVVTGPDNMIPSELFRAYFFHNLGANATYTGDLYLIWEDDNSALLEMPMDAEPGSTWTARWVLPPCNIIAAKTVTRLPECDSSVIRAGYGDPVGQYVRQGTTPDVCGVVTGTVLYSIAAYSPGSDGWEVGLGWPAADGVGRVAWSPLNAWTIVYYAVEWFE